MHEERKDLTGRVKKNAPLRSGEKQSTRSQGGEGRGGIGKKKRTKTKKKKKKNTKKKKKKKKKKSKRTTNNEGGTQKTRSS